LGLPMPRHILPVGVNQNVRVECNQPPRPS
jgi:hypothetical protein